MSIHIREGGSDAKRVNDARGRFDAYYPHLVAMTVRACDHSGHEEESGGPDADQPGF